MSLVEDFQISLKDFLPQDDARLVSNKSGPVAVVSNRLYGKLKDCAASKGIPLGAVIEQLRDEVHD